MSSSLTSLLVDQALRHENAELLAEKIVLLSYTPTFHELDEWVEEVRSPLAEAQDSTDDKVIVKKIKNGIVDVLLRALAHSLGQSAGVSSRPILRWTRGRIASWCLKQIVKLSKQKGMNQTAAILWSLGRTKVKLYGRGSGKSSNIIVKMGGHKAEVTLGGVSGAFLSGYFLALGKEFGKPELRLGKHPSELLRSAQLKAYQDEPMEIDDVTLQDALAMAAALTASDEELEQLLALLKRANSPTEFRTILNVFMRKSGEATDSEDEPDADTREKTDGDSDS